MHRITWGRHARSTYLATAHDPVLAVLVHPVLTAVLADTCCSPGTRCCAGPHRPKPGPPRG